MLTVGGELYAKSNVLAMQSGHGSDTTYAQKLIRNFMEPLVDDLNEWIENKANRIMGRTRPLIRQLPPEHSIFFTLKSVFNSFIEQQGVVETAVDIGRMCEDEIRFTKFQKEHGAYYEKIIQDFKRKGTADYRFMHRVLTH